MLFDYHMHLENGPIRMDWLREFVDAAARNGIGEIGVSEHMFRFREATPVWPSWWELQPDCSLDEYVDLIQRARSLVAPVKIGVEAEYLRGREGEIRDFLEKAPWDYVIGSVHYIGEWGFDDSARKNEWDSKDVNAAYREYYGLLEEAIRSGLFDVIGHPDVIKVFGHRPTIDLGAYYDRIADAAKSCGVAVEVSTAGLRKPVKEMYPHADFLRAFARMGVPIVISSDAHYPEHVGFEFARAIEFAGSMGYRTITRFSRRIPSQVPLVGEGNG